MKTNIYTFNKETLEYERVSLKTILILPTVLFLGLLFNYLYFRAEIIEDWQWKYSRGKELEKVNTKITVEEWIIEK